MPRALLIAVLALLAGCGGSDGAGGGDGDEPETSLTITVRPEGTEGAVVMEWTLRCGPDGGTLPRPEEACAKLDGLGREAFDPVPENVACTEIYGGPQVASVEGIFRGEPLQARFDRTNGCQIERWNRVSFLFPPDDGA